MFRISGLNSDLSIPSSLVQLTLIAIPLSISEFTLWRYRTLLTALFKSVLSFSLNWTTHFLWPSLLPPSCLLHQPVWNNITSFQFSHYLMKEKGKKNNPNPITCNTEGYPGSTVVCRTYSPLCFSEINACQYLVHYSFGETFIIISKFDTGICSRISTLF